MYKAFLRVVGPHLVCVRKSEHLTCLTQGEEIEGMETQKSAAFFFFPLETSNNSEYKQRLSHQ